MQTTPCKPKVHTHTYYNLQLNSTRGSACGNQKKKTAERVTSSRHRYEGLQKIATCRTCLASSITVLMRQQQQKQQTA